MGNNSVALLDHGFGKELAEVAEADNGDLELCGVGEAIVELGLIIVRLCSVNSPDAKRSGDASEKGGTAEHGRTRGWNRNERKARGAQGTRKREWVSREKILDKKMHFYHSAAAKTKWEGPLLQKLNKEERRKRETFSQSSFLQGEENKGFWRFI